MSTITIRQGETLQLPITVDDTSAETVQFQVLNNGTVEIDETETFTDGKATIRTDNTMLDLGEYEYMITITYSDGVIDKLPDPDNCDTGNCGLPAFIVCEGGIPGVS